MPRDHSVGAFSELILLKKRNHRFPSRCLQVVVTFALTSASGVTKTALPAKRARKK